MEYTGTTETDILVQIESLDGEIRKYKIPLSLWEKKLMLINQCTDPQISRSWTINLSKHELQELIDKE